MCILSVIVAQPGERVSTLYLPEKNRMVFSDSMSVGVRRDLQGVLLMDTALQTPLTAQKDKVRLELPLAEVCRFTTPKRYVAFANIQLFCCKV